MSIFEVETWEIADGNHAQHHEMIRNWVAFLREHPELFEGWKSVRYYRQISLPEGAPTGRYVMQFEYESLEARNAYKERRKDFTGPYAKYKEVDPYQFFDHSTVTLEAWEAQEEGLWFSFDELEHSAS